MAKNYKYKYQIELEEANDNLLDRSLIMSLLPAGSMLRTFNDTKKEIKTIIQIETDIAINPATISSKIKQKEEDGSLFKAKPKSLLEKIEELEAKVKALETK